jgi:bifunctional DNA-binding transcriptional regulator/antitoxin component of YhaV-PrlF toxin-antitoxin module
LEKTLGSSKVQPNFRVTLTLDVRNKLRVKVGSFVMFVEGEHGEIVLKKAELKAV